MVPPNAPGFKRTPLNENGHRGARKSLFTNAKRTFRMFPKAFLVEGVNRMWLLNNAFKPFLGGRKYFVPHNVPPNMIV